MKRKLVFLWFAAGFMSSRMFVRAAGIGNPQSPTGKIFFLPLNQVWLAGYHIHHYVLGAVLIFVAGAAYLKSDSFSLKTASLFGLGLGVFMDEAGFILSGGNYSSTLTYPIVAVVALILFLSSEKEQIKI